MSKLKEKYNNFKQSIRQNGIKTEIRRIKNYVKHKKTVLDEYEEWQLLNEIDEKKVHKVNFNTKFLILLNNEKEQENIPEQIYKKYKIEISKPCDYYNKIKESESDFCIFIGENIKLLSFTLYEIAKFIEYNECNLIYADHDYLDDNQKRINPIFKPHYAYDNILSKNYFDNFIVIKTKFLLENKDLLENINEVEPIYNIILRSISKTDRVMHIDKILFSKYKEDIVNENEQMNIIKEYLDYNNIKYTDITKGKFEGQYKINYKIDGEPLVSIIIPNMDHIEDLDKAIKSILKSSYKNYEIIIVENNSKNQETFKYYDKISAQDDRIIIEKMTINEFNYSKIVNYGVKKSKGEYIILLNNDIEIISNDWIEQMLMYTQRKNVGICGAKLYFPDRSVQHAGVTIGIRGLAGHKYREVNEEEYTKYDNINFVQDLSAVTAACFMTKRQLYDKVLGFDEKLAVAFNDVDYCLKVRKEKMLIVYNPFAELYHYESKSRGQDDSKEKQKRFAKEYELFVKRWRNTIAKGDPYYSLNYRLDKDIPTINYNRIRR